MSHSLITVNSVGADNTGNINLGLSSLITATTSNDIVAIDAAGNAKKLKTGFEVGNVCMSFVCQNGGWGGNPALSNGSNLVWRTASATVVNNASLITLQTAGSAGWLQSWTAAAGNYIFIINQAVDTAQGGECNLQVYNVTDAAHEGTKAHLKTGNFSTTLIHYVSISSSKQYQIRVRDLVGSIAFLNATALFSCTLQIIKI